jgi:uncharacterized protein
MSSFGHAIKTAAICLATLLVVAPLAASDGTEPVPPRTAAVAKKVHRLVLQVNSNEAAMMNLALNNAANVEQYFKDRGERVEIEVVAFGAGLHMLRTTPHR